MSCKIATPRIFKKKRSWGDPSLNPWEHQWLEYYWRTKNSLAEWFRLRWTDMKVLILLFRMHCGTEKPWELDPWAIKHTCFATRVTFRSMEGTVWVFDYSHITNENEAVSRYIDFMRVWYTTCVTLQHPHIKNWRYIFYTSIVTRVSVIH